MGVMKRLAMPTRAPRLGGGRGSFLEVEWFFDSAKVLRAVDRAARRVLSKFGAYVRRTAQQSICRPTRKPRSQWTPADHRRYRRTGRWPLASSRPGEPPRNRTNKLRGNMMFWYDPQERGVTIGPGLFRRSQDVPGVLEHAGIIPKGPARGRRMEARPYMGPALQKELPGLPAMWRDSVKEPG